MTQVLPVPPASPPASFPSSFPSSFLSGCHCESFPADVSKPVPPDPGLTDSPSFVLIGEAPGQHEHERGRPWVGQAGQFLDHLLSSAGILRQSVYLTNVVKCRPVKLQPKMVQDCRHWLHLEMSTVRPSFIVCAGATAVREILGPDVSVERCHGRPTTIVKDWGQVLVLPMYHPAAGLHDTDRKSVV